MIEIVAGVRDCVRARASDSDSAVALLFVTANRVEKGPTTCTHPSPVLSFLKKQLLELFPRYDMYG